MYKVGQKHLFLLASMDTKQSKTNVPFLCNPPSLFPFSGGSVGGGGNGAWASFIHFVLRILHFFERNKESEFSGRQIIFSLEFAGNLLMYCLGF